MRLADLAWVAGLFVLGSYETWALLTGHLTLSRAVWTAESGPYGTLLPLLAGVLAGHFFAVDWRIFSAFAFGVLGGKLFWHKVG